MSKISLRLSHKILSIGLIGLLGLVSFGAIYLIGSASQDASRKIAEEARSISAINEKLGRVLLDARRNEKDFLLRHDEASSKRHAALTVEINREIVQLGVAVKAAGLDSLVDKVGALAKGLSDYQKHFTELEQSEVKLGLNEKLGLSGSLRGSVHDIEGKLKDAGDSKLTAGMLMMRRYEKDFMLRRDRKYVDEFQQSAAGFEKQIAASELAPATKTEIVNKLQKYRADFAAWADAAQQSAQVAAAISKDYAQIEPVIEQIEKDIQHRRDAAVAQELETHSAVKRAMLIALGLATVIVLGISLAIGRAVTNAITAMVRAMAGLARGNLKMTVPGVGRRDEIGEMAAAVDVFKVNMIEAERLRAEQAEIEQRQAQQRKADMHRLAEQFEAAVGEVIQAVSSASTELEASATTLTATAQRGQEVTTAVAAASEETSTNVQSVASATEEMASSVHEISRQVQESARIASEAVVQANKTNERVGELSSAAARIGDVVELISTIAGQTNLLALNATIEAARAGEAGRGFAVVASEVKALAEQTAKATGEISQQINGIQAATQGSVSAIKEISSTIGRMSEIASTIASAVEEQGAATQEISRNVQQAAQGTHQVSSNITDVQRGASETGSASSQVLSAAQSLSRDSNRLKLEVGKFLATVRAG